MNKMVKLIGNLNRKNSNHHRVLMNDLMQKQKLSGYFSIKYIRDYRVQMGMIQTQNNPQRWFILVARRPIV